MALLIRIATLSYIAGICSYVVNISERLRGNSANFPCQNFTLCSVIHTKLPQWSYQLLIWTYMVICISFILLIVATVY